MVHPRITHLILRNENLEWNIDADHLRRLHQQRPAVAVLDEPAREWSLDELALIAAVSRATLVRAFRRICGVPPWAFLRRFGSGSRETASYILPMRWARLRPMSAINPKRR